MSVGGRQAFHQIILLLCVSILANGVAAFRLLPARAQEEKALEIVELSATNASKQNVSDDYGKYSYLITTYL
ncbi:hypothetical protein MSG28_009249 [Choristoneura fumiferana]|uniref:Uncharacterized protein n=1 Tax=Choristoneura fumiferana TaxID=7141 RepID=A0ACC0KXE3_CHOFU|nr:hypothetical protein MSG28_009249 [Choristoneura fumiferana]